MLNFLRKLRRREMKTGRYIKYALGEIFLVMIGILLALGINNWNEKRKSKDKELVLINNIIEDLKEDAIHFQESLDELTPQLQLLDSLITDALDQKKTTQHHAIGLLRYSSDLQPISQRNHLESVSTIDDVDIRKSLQQYFIIENDTRDRFLEYEDIVQRKIRPYLSEVGMHNLKALYIESPEESVDQLLIYSVLQEQLDNINFQQLLFEHRMKTEAFMTGLNDLIKENEALTIYLTKRID